MALRQADRPRGARRVAFYGVMVAREVVLEADCGLCLVAVVIMTIHRAG